MARVAEAGRELGYDHVWAGEHLVADSATGDRVGRSLDPMASLAAGADGFVLVFGGEDGGIAEMRRFATEVKPRLVGTSPR